MRCVILKAKEKCRGVLVRAIKRLKHVVPLYFSLGGLHESERLPAPPDSVPKDLKTLLAAIVGCKVESDVDGVLWEPREKRLGRHNQESLNCVLINNSRGNWRRHLKPFLKMGQDRPVSCLLSYPLNFVNFSLCAYVLYL